MVEEHMVIGTQAKDVVCGIRSVVRCAKRAYVRGFSVRTGKALKADTAHLTPAVMELLDPPRLPSISYDSQHRGFLPRSRREAGYALWVRSLAVRLLWYPNEPVAPDAKTASTDFVPVVVHQV
jgi:hypothetical protein